MNEEELNESILEGLWSGLPSKFQSNCPYKISTGKCIKKLYCEYRGKMADCNYVGDRSIDSSTVALSLGEAQKITINPKSLVFIVDKEPIKLEDDLFGVDNIIIRTSYEDLPVLEFCSNGDILIKGEKIAEDKQMVDKLKEYMKRGNLFK